MIRDHCAGHVQHRTSYGSKFTSSCRKRPTFAVTLRAIESDPATHLGACSTHVGDVVRRLTKGHDRDPWAFVRPLDPSETSPAAEADPS